MTTEFDRLGSDAFQDFSAALATAVFGASVQSMGPGRDGGRDMYCRGELAWAGTSGHPAEVWQGYTVFQAKFRSERDSKDVSWLWEEIRKELTKWADPVSGRKEIPQNLIFITNVPLTPVPETGGRAVIDKKVQDFIDRLNSTDVEDSLTGSGKTRARQDRLARVQRMQNLERWYVWDANQLQALLAANPSVKQGFNGFLTAGDILAIIPDLSKSLNEEELGQALNEHARDSLLGERNIYLAELGGSGVRVHVNEVVVDLPVMTDNDPEIEGQGILKRLINQGDKVLRPEITNESRPYHRVITGTPGNGKTTISRFLIQAYRASFLSETKVGLSESHHDAIRDTVSALSRIDCGLPKNRRWPFRIDLAAYSDAQRGKLEPESILQWIAAKINARSDNKEVKPWVLKSWLKQWPSIIVFDGLDEVSEPAIRNDLITTIEQFIANAEADNWDLLAIVTTRPTGYREELEKQQFERIDLGEFTTEQALAYGELISQHQIGKDLEQLEKVDALMLGAAGDEGLRNLLRTPLQVTFMVLLAAVTGHFASTRYDLFWEYYLVLERREKSKQGGFGVLVRDNESTIRRLHERVGLLLQAKAESSSGSNAVLSPDELRHVAKETLADEGFDPDGVDLELLDAIINATTLRLVLLAPRADESGFGFDIRSLQELMAGRMLTTGDLEDVVKNLSYLADSPHWRNTWIFAAGRFFTESQPQPKQAVTNLLQTVDRNATHRLGDICPIGPELAWDLIDDGMANSQPKLLGQLLETAIDTLNYPPPSDIQGWAERILRCSNASNRVASALIGAIQMALGYTEVSQETTTLLQNEIKIRLGKRAYSSEIRSLPGIRKAPDSPSPSPVESDWNEFDSAFSSLSEDLEHEHVEKSRNAILNVRDSNTSADDVEIIQLALTEPHLADLIDTALTSVVPGDKEMYYFLKDTVLPDINRMPRANGLLIGASDGFH